MRRLLPLALLMSTCNGPHTPPQAAAPEGEPAAKIAFVAGDDEVQGLEIVLSEGAPPGGRQERAPVAQAEPLSEAETARLLARLPPLEGEPGDAVDFAKREDSLPPPQTGARVDVPFPPPEAPDAPDAADSAPLAVLRWSPEGEVPIAPQVSVTFSHPMTAVTSHAGATQRVPVKLDPQPPGKWRWIGTKTLLFQPEGQMPKATQYTVTVPAGTESVSGQPLGEGFTATFATPPLTLQQRYPSDGVPTDLEPLILVGFDQRIDPEALKGSLSLTAGRSDVPWRAATAQEIAADKVVSRLVEPLLDGRYVVIRPQSPLPKAATVTVTVESGAPSAEGPRKTTSDQEFSFQTYGPFEVTDSRCGYQQRCQPYDRFEIQLSNPVDGEAFDVSQVAIEPALPGAGIWASGQGIYIDGLKQAQTTYTVTLSGSLKDTFGQTLGEPASRTFKVGKGDPLPPAVTANWSDLLVLDPAGDRTLPIYTTNLDKVRVRAYRVGPEQWNDYKRWRRFVQGYDEGRGVNPPGTEIADATIATSGAKDTPSEHLVPLDPYLTEGKGQILVWITPSPQPRERWQQTHLVAWVQATEIGLHAAVDDESLLGWASSLRDGASLPGVSLSLGGAQAATDASGLAELPLSEAPAQMLIARQGSDVAFLPQDAGWWNTEGGWQVQHNIDQTLWYVADDRKMYRPGETVRVKGWLRSHEPRKGGGLALSPAKKVDWRLMDSVGNEIIRGQADASSSGGFDLSLKLPPTMNLGDAWVYLTADGTEHGHAFQVQEFRRPEYEVTSSADPGPHILGETAVATATAAYYAGGGLPGADVSWNVTATPGTYAPPGHDEYTFGPWTPWWIDYGWHGRGRGGVWPDSSPTNRFSLAGTTDAAGNHYLQMHFRALNPARPMQVTAEAAITDVNRQTWASSTSLLVHPAAVYVGLKSEKPFVDKGQPVVVDLIAADIDGKLVAGRAITVTAERKAWKIQKNGAWEEEVVETHTCEERSGDKPAVCRFTPEAGGAFTLTARVTDAEGRPNESVMVVWVSGAEPEPARTIEAAQVTLVPDKKEYQPGETAEILVQSPIAPAEALVTWRREGIVHRQRIRLEGASTVINVPVTAEHIPNLEVRVDVVGSAARTDASGAARGELAPRPAYGSGTVNLAVPPLQRTLKVAVQPASAGVTPGGETSVTVTVTDAAGKPVSGAEVAVFAVDESVLALTGYRLPDPIQVFYPQRPGDTYDYAARGYVWLADPAKLKPQDARGGFGGGPGGPPEERAVVLESLGYAADGLMTGGAMPPPAPAPAAATTPDVAQAEAKKAPARGRAANGADKDQENSAGQPVIAVRTDFDPLALFLPAVPTDGKGAAKLTLKVPDSLTRYRITAVAVSQGDRFGIGESNVTARLPLMLRPSPPRFLNFGDRFALPLVVQNQGDAPVTVDLAVRATNAYFLPDLASDAQAASAGRRVVVAAGDRVEVQIPARADRAGKARFQVAVSAGSFADAAVFELPVWTPATAEAFATYGQIDGDGGTAAVRQPYQVPDDIWTQHGGLEVTTTSTALANLTDAVVYLVQYPYGCVEQISSRVLAIAALRDVLAAFEAEGLPEPDELKAGVEADIKEIARRQNPDGGWGFWRMGERSWPFVTVHGAHALVRAKEKGFAVPDQTLARAMGYLKNVERHIPREYGPQARRTITAYALYVRHLSGDSAPGAARKLLAEVPVAEHPLETLGWLLPILQEGKESAQVESILRHLGNRVSETAGAAHFVTSYGESEDYVVLDSDRRVDGVLLEALIAVQPKNDLIPKLVEGLLGHRTAGRWSSTQDNVFVLLAMDRYFHEYEGTPPDLVARAWVGDRFAGEHAFKGRSTEKAHIDVPMAYLAEVGDGDLILANMGEGRLYYRIGMRYAPRSLDLAPEDQGFAVERTYEAVDDPADVTREADGTWRIKAGARVRVRVEMVAPGRRTHVALVDPLPAGLEVLNPALAVTEELPPDPKAADPSAAEGRYWWWWRPWYEHENLRDDRVEAFTSLLWGGVHSYTYVARATTPGRFVVPPAKAEEMYHPETFGRSATDKVVVE